MLSLLDDVAIFGAVAGVEASTGPIASRQGMVNQNRLPTPSRLSAPIVPSISSTSCLQIESPRPVPPIVAGRSHTRLFEALELPRLLFGRQADAAVGDLEAQQAPPVRPVGHREENRDFAVLGELDRISDEIDEDLAQANGFAVDMVRHTVGGLADEVEVPCFRYADQQMQYALDQVREIEVGIVDLELAGFQFRLVENIVQDRQQNAAGLLDGLHFVSLFRRQRLHQQQVCHAQDTGHRRADLVAHRREKGRLRGVRRFRVPFRGFGGDGEAPLAEQQPVDREHGHADHQNEADDRNDEGAQLNALVGYGVEGGVVQVDAEMLDRAGFSGEVSQLGHQCCLIDRRAL